MQGVIGVIGAGNMGQAIIKSIKAARKIKKIKEDILIFEKEKKSAQKVCRALKIKKTDTLEDLIKSAKTIIICVKPQDIDELLEKMSGLDLKNKLIVSIAAGITTSFITKKLKTKIAVIRVMPNINVMVGAGVDAMCKGRYAKKEDLAYVERIFIEAGEDFVIPERQMDIITAVSGSGPAYAALFISALSAAAQKNGLKDAEKIVLQTLEGTLEMLRKQKISPRDFIDKVKSKGGTTEAAFKVFKEREFEKIISRAVSAAKKRSIELRKN